MSANTDPAASDDSAASNAATSSPHGMESSSAPPPATQRKPRFAIFIATAAGLGYFPKAPGTFGSLAGLLIALLPLCVLVGLGIVSNDHQIRSLSLLGGDALPKPTRTHRGSSAIS